MAAGLCASWPFRKTWLEEHDSLVSEALSAAQAAPLQPPLVRSQPQLEHDEPSPALDSQDPVPGLHPLASALERGLTQRSLVRLEERPQVPALAADYSAADSQRLDPRSAVLGADTSPVMDSQPPPPQHLRRYRIARHDTLEAIAERLMGSRAHADKLLAANADVILFPEVLPVGATIVIPELSATPETIVRRPEEGN